jgi:hypothetical protein
MQAGRLKKASRRYPGQVMCDCEGTACPAKAGVTGEGSHTLAFVYWLFSISFFISLQQIFIGTVLFQACW